MGEVEMKTTAGEISTSHGEAATSEGTRTSTTKKVCYALGAVCLYIAFIPVALGVLALIGWRIASWFI